jgi:hypothetical protein
MKPMALGARVSFGGLAAVFGAALSALSALGCDTGGLLTATGTDIDRPPLVGHSSTEIVSGGTVRSFARPPRRATRGGAPVRGCAR